MLYSIVYGNSIVNFILKIFDIIILNNDGGFDISIHVLPWREFDVVTGDALFISH